MLYNSLKIIHILTATLFLMGVVYSSYLWKQVQNAHDAPAVSQQIQSQTWLVIIPCALLQLMTGFTMLSLKHYDYSQTWVIGSVIGFILVIGSWFSFVYFLLLSQQLITQTQNSHQLEMKFKFLRRIQSFMLMFCIATLGTMVFLMANRI